MRMINYNIVIVGLFTFLLVGCNSKVDEAVNTVEHDDYQETQSHNDGYDIAPIVTGVAVGAVVGSMMNKANRVDNNKQRTVIAPVNNSTKKPVKKVDIKKQSVAKTSVKRNKVKITKRKR